MSVVLENAVSWKNALEEEFSKAYMLELKHFLRAEKDQGKVIYPHSSNWFHALETTPLDEVKVVILGQDPYHQPHQAHGLCFSVQAGVKVPPSLVNIYKELQSDLAIEPVNHGYLESWATQGVLLLNAVLTVEDSRANAHQGKGWEQFTDAVINILNEKRTNIVYMLWGTYAKQKGAMVDADNNLILTSAHPSPFSAQAFFGNKHFSSCNLYLTSHGMSPIDWK